MNRIRWIVRQLVDSFLWAYYRGSGPDKVLSTDAIMVKMEVNGEIDDYRFLPPWQWMSVDKLGQCEAGWERR